VGSGILVELLEWLAGSLAVAREALPPASSQMSSVVAAYCCCHCSIMEFHGANCLSDVSAFVAPLLDAGNLSPLHLSLPCFAVLCKLSRILSLKLHTHVLSFFSGTTALSANRDEP
jgi:hypothetical protein